MWLKTTAIYSAQGSRSQNIGSERCRHSSGRQALCPSPMGVCLCLFTGVLGLGTQSWGHPPLAIPFLAAREPVLGGGDEIASPQHLSERWRELDGSL